LVGGHVFCFLWEKSPYYSFRRGNPDWLITTIKNENLCH
jgi:hypothetical protein